MENLKIASVQFENRSGDKTYNLDLIRQLAAEAAGQGADVVAFHECSITGYTFARNLSREEMLDLAELIPDGPSVKSLIAIAKEYQITILAGLFEKDALGALFKAYICVDETGLIAKHRKLHPFINPHLSAGTAYTIFEIKGWKCGILICYDNNIIENVRATTLLGAQVIFMPHVTMCTPSTRPGAGFVDAELWKNKEENSALLRAEFDGLKGRSWLMKWLPARAYDNAIYAVFANPIGMDDDQLKNGCAMIIDPYGDVMAECRSLGNEICVAELTADKLMKAGGYRYIRARKPELYRDILGQQHLSEQKVVWLHK
ncbi:Glutamine amidotransferase chain of NAD synthetase [Sphingobacterium faecium PCAi_F2.5]|jgi:predicted amidohydrolase|uniref:nitrilase family protein n=1 Tax=Sphingobacterium TaxID=28453 RepID=UPI00097F6665|nr:nitrilase family protein [Sphingobacterium sp. UBA6320]SJN49287.1 Glutamine amidotransferase chain of NAD synthetase [Sphingobacterium faecium PCAi_F2.5]